MKGRYLAFLIVSLVTGILIGRLQFADTWLSLVPLACALGLFLTICFKSRKNPFFQSSPVNEIIAYLLFIALGNFSSSISKPNYTSFKPGTYTFTGQVSDYTASNRGDKLLVKLTSLVLEDKAQPRVSYPDIRGVKALITLNDATDVSYGSLINGTASLYPSDMPGNFKNDDYIDYLLSKSIFLKGDAVPEDCKIDNRNLPSTSFFPRLRNNLEAVIESTPLKIETKNFLISILLGDKTYLGKEERLIFTDAGVAHIFAVSGLHVSLIAMFILAVLSLFLQGSLRRWSFILCVPLVWFYVLLVGATPVTCRAAIMISIAMIALFLQRRNNALTALGWSVILVLAFSPDALFDIGFQIGVVCVGSLILIAQPLNFINHRSHPRMFRIVSVVLVTLTATFSSWLLCAFYFHRFTLMFLPLNLLCVPLLPIFLSGVIIYLVFFSLGINIAFLANAIDGIYNAFLNSAYSLTGSSETFANLHPGVPAVVAWTVGLCVLGYVLCHKNRLKLLWIPLSIFLVSLLSFNAFQRDLPSGFIIQKNSHRLALAVYANGIESLLDLPAQKTTMADVGDKKLLSIGMEELSEYTKTLVSKADVILISKGCKSIPEEVFACLKEGSKIVTHPTLHWQYERNMISQASERGVGLHSIRYNGPFHLFD